MLGLRQPPPTGPCLGPSDVLRAGTMAGFAANADLREACGKAIGRRIVILAHAGRMALRAHEVPILVELRPMQKVVVANLLVGIEMKPALTTLVPRSTVPGER